MLTDFPTYRSTRRVPGCDWLTSEVGSTCRLVIGKGDIGRKTATRAFSGTAYQLNAETPEEIAVSIMAEIISLRRGGLARKCQVLN